MQSYTNIPEYISNFPPKVRASLQKLRTAIRKTAPEATEKIAYGIPTYVMDGNLIHFAAYEHHIAIYPGPDAIKAFRKELNQFKTSKGAIQFPIDAPLPIGLITKIVKLRVQATLAKRPKQEIPHTSNPAARALEHAGIKTLAGMAKYSEKEILSLHGIGPASIPVWKKALKAKGLSFKK